MSSVSIAILVFICFLVLYKYTTFIAIYQFFKQLYFNLGKVFISNSRNFKNYAEQVRYNLHSLLQDPYFDDYHKLVDTIFDYAIELRTNEPMFWLDIVDCGDVKNNTYFYAIRHFAGSPLIETAKHELFWRNRQTLWGGITDANQKLLLNDT